MPRIGPNLNRLGDEILDHLDQRVGCGFGFVPFTSFRFPWLVRRHSQMDGAGRFGPMNNHMEIPEEAIFVTSELLLILLLRRLSR